MAMPKLADSGFASSLAIICEHNQQGALGIVVNRPTNLKLPEVFQQAGLENHNTDYLQNDVVYSGGPVAVERGFVLNSSEKNWSASVPVCSGLQLTTSKDILVAISKQQGPHSFLLALGYAGWGAGQLEQELADNVWINCQADPAIIFETPVHKRLKEAASSIGVNLSLISSQVGHA